MGADETAKLIEVLQALDEVPPEGVPDRLRDLCANDEALLCLVEEHLALGSSAESIRDAALSSGVEGTAADASKASAADPLPPLAFLPPGARVGAYRIVSKIGEGGMGVVYEAEQTVPRRTVALKILRPDYALGDGLGRIRREADILGRLKHPAITQIHEFGSVETREGACPFFALEHVEGRAITEYVRVHALSVKDTLGLFVKVANAVQYAHEKGVIHRDLKPANILIEESGEPKVLDFGVARATGPEFSAVSRATVDGQIIGTPSYMSPEQAAGDPAATDTRSDVYALGVILHEMLAGALPYDVEGKPLVEIVRTIQEAEPRPLGSLRRELRGDVARVVAKALSKARGERYASAAEFAADVERRLRGEPVLARPPTVLTRFVRWRTRHRAVFAAMLTAMTMVLALSVWAVYQSAVERRVYTVRLESVLSSMGGLPGDADLVSGESVEELVGLLPHLGGFERYRALRALAAISSQFGRHEEAWRLLEKARGEPPAEEETPWSLFRVRVALQVGNREPETRTSADRILRDLASRSKGDAPRCEALRAVAQRLGPPAVIALEDTGPMEAACAVELRGRPGLLISYPKAGTKSHLLGFVARERLLEAALRGERLTPRDLELIALPRDIFRRDPQAADLEAKVIRLLAVPPKAYGGYVAFAVYTEESEIPGSESYLRLKVAVLAVDESGTAVRIHAFPGIHGFDVRPNAMAWASLPVRAGGGPVPGILLGTNNSDRALWFFAPRGEAREPRTARESAFDAHVLYAQPEAKHTPGWDVNSVAVLPPLPASPVASGARIVLNFGNWGGLRTLLLEWDEDLGSHVRAWERPLGVCHLAVPVDTDRDGIDDSVLLGAGESVFDGEVFGPRNATGTRLGFYLLRASGPRPTLEFLAPATRGTMPAFARTGRVAGHGVCLVVSVGMDVSLPTGPPASELEVFVCAPGGPPERIPVPDPGIVSDALLTDLDGDGSDELLTCGDTLKIHGLAPQAR